MGNLRVWLAVLVAAGLASPAAAQAAAVTVSPAPGQPTLVGGACYVSGQTLTVHTTGFTPSELTTATFDNGPPWPIGTDTAGSGSASLTLGLLRGVRDRTITVTDRANPAISAAATIRTSGIQARIPKRFVPGARIRVAATGFITGRRLYAHLVHGRVVRTYPLGALRGRCGALRTRARITPRRTTVGTYTLQFDTSKRYSPTTRPNVRIFFYRLYSRGAAAAACTGAQIRLS